MTEEKITTFEELALSPEILKAVKRMGFSNPTPVQAQTIPAMMDGNDVIAKAPTGTGKTCAFGIPLIEAGPVFRGTVVTDGSNLNLRQFPSTQGDVIGSIPNGSVLTVYSRSNGWDVVSYRGTVGYASSEFIVI